MFLPPSSFFCSNNNHNNDYINNHNIYIYISLFLCFSPDSYYIDSLNHFHKNFDHGFFDRRYDHSRRRNFSFLFFF